MAVERKYERDIDILLAEEFAVSPEFATWFLEHTKKLAGIRAKVFDVYFSRSDVTGESDLVVVFDKADSDTRFALLIEDKIDAPLQPEQEARYRLRAEAEIIRATTPITKSSFARRNNIAIHTLKCPRSTASYRV